MQPNICKKTKAVASNDYINEIEPMEDIHKLTQSNVCHVSDRMKTQYGLRANETSFNEAGQV